MGQTAKWPKLYPITMNLDETKWDRIPAMSRTFLGEFRGPSGAKLNDLGGTMLRNSEKELNTV